MKNSKKGNQSQLWILMLLAVSVTAAADTVITRAGASLFRAFPEH
jgi:hypothetical protein